MNGVNKKTTYMRKQISRFWHWEITLEKKQWWSVTKKNQYNEILGIIFIVQLSSVLHGFTVGKMFCIGK